MIQVGDNPEGAAGINKFLAGAEGFRGKLLALHRSGTQAVILAHNASFDGHSVQLE